MNSGTTGHSNDFLDLQGNSQQLFKDYYNNVMPAMGYAARNIKAAGGASGIAAGKAAGSSNVMTANADTAMTSRSSGTGVLPGSGAFSQRTGAIMAAGAGRSGVASGVARVGPQAQANQQTSALNTAGLGSVQNALKSLAGETNIADATLEADTANKAMPLQELTALGISTGMAALKAA